MTRSLLLVAFLLASTALSGCTDGVHTARVTVDGGADATTTAAVEFHATDRPSAYAYQDCGFAHPDAFTVHDLMEAWRKAGEGTYQAQCSDDFGFFMTSINGKAGLSGDAGCTYWSLRINGTDSMVGMSTAVVTDGTSVTWTYTSC